METKNVSHGQGQTGRLFKIVPDISLKETEYFNTCNFFKTKKKGGIFSEVSWDIFIWFETEIKNSPAKELASYELTKDVTEEDIVGDAKGGGIYEEIDLAHVGQICLYDFIEGKKLFKKNGQLNLFWVRDKKGNLCEVLVWRDADGWNVDVRRFNAPSRWSADSRSFFRN